MDEGGDTFGENGGIEQEGMRIEIKYLLNHSNSKEDLKEISQSDLKQLDRYCKFDKQFPFYRMDVSGFIHELNRSICCYNR